MNMNYLLISVAMTILASCNKEGINLKSNDYLIFGHYYGHCLGEKCVQTYKLTKNELFKDFKDRFVDSDPDFRPLGNDAFMRTKNIVDVIPSELINADQTTFGCPDCADQGGLIIKIYRDGKVQSWTIDQSKAAVPGYLHDFMDAINETIELINN